MLNIYFTGYHVIVKNVILMLVVFVFIVTPSRYTSTHCSELTRIISIHIQRVAGVVTTVSLVTTTQLTTGHGIATNVIMIFVTTALVPRSQSIQVIKHVT